MPKVKLKHERESFEALMRRFKRACEKDNLLIELRKREQYEKPTTKRNRKKAAARKREEKRTSETDIFSKRFY